MCTVGLASTLAGNTSLLSRAGHEGYNSFLKGIFNYWSLSNVLLIFDKLLDLFKFMRLRNLTA